MLAVVFIFSTLIPYTSIKNNTAHCTSR